MKLNKGFTLIELLVVIAIIGMLAGIILVSLGQAKGRGNDTAVKADLATIDTQAVLYYGLGNTYGATNTGSSASCSATGTVFNDTSTTVDAQVQSAITDAQKNANGKAAGVICQSVSQSFLVAAELTDDTYWCVDSIGSAKSEASAPANTATICP